MGRAEVTRERLIAHGRVAFAAKGHDGVSLHKDVLAPSGVSTGSFYHQFEDKTQLLIAILTEATDAAQEVFAATLVSSSDIEIDDVFTPARVLFETWFDIIDVGEDLFRIVLRERDNADARVRRLVRKLQDSWVDSVAATLGRRLDIFGLDVDVRLAAELIAALGSGLLLQYLDTSPSRRSAFRESKIDGLAHFTVGGLVQMSDLTANATS